MTDATVPVFPLFAPPVGGRPMSRGLVDVRDWRLKRDVDRLCESGSRYVYEVFAELGEAHMIRSEIEDLIRRYLAAFCPRRGRQ